MRAKTKSLINIIIIIALIVILLGCDDKVKKHSLTKCSEVSIAVPKGIDYVSDFLINEHGGLMIAGGIRRDDHNVEAAIWETLDDGGNWVKVFSQPFNGKIGYTEPVVNMINETACLIENNDWDLEKMQAVSTDCYYIKNIKSNTLEKIFENSEKSGLIGRAEFINADTGFEIEYNAEKEKITLYRINISKNTIQEEHLERYISPFEYTTLNNNLYFFSEESVFEYVTDTKTLSELDSWASSSVKEIEDIHDKKGKSFAAFDDSGELCIYYAGPNGLKNNTQNGQVKFDTSELTFLNHDNTIYYSSIKNQNEMYFCYYNKDKINICKVNITKD